MADNEIGTVPEKLWALWFFCWEKRRIEKIIIMKNIFFVTIKSIPFKSSIDESS